MNKRMHVRSKRQKPAITQIKTSRLHKEKLPLYALIAVGMGLIGSLLLLGTHALTSNPNTEVELGTVGGGAKSVNDGSASGGFAVKFGYKPGVVGSYKPSTNTSGYAPYHTHLTAYTNQFGAISGGVLTITTANTTISGYDIPARIAIKANNVTIAKSYIHGDATALTADHGLVECVTAGVTGCIIEDSILAPSTPSYYWNGIRGHDFTAQRNNIYDVVDGIDTYGSVADADLHISILANYIHDLAGFSPDTPNSRPFTHNDCIQMAGGFDITVRGNFFVGFLDPNVGQANQDPSVSKNVTPTVYSTNSILQVNQSSTYGVTRSVVFDSNWLDGGATSINAAAGSMAAGNVGTFTNNKFSHRQYYQGGSSTLDGDYSVVRDTTVTFTSAGGMTFTAPNASVPFSGLDPNGGNTYEDNGHTITVRLN